MSIADDNEEEKKDGNEPQMILTGLSPSQSMQAAAQ